MWTYINKENVDNYIQQYPVLEQDWNAYNLLETQDVIFLPKLFKFNYPSSYLEEYMGKTQPNPIKVNFSFTGTLRPLQEEAWNIVKKLYDKHNHINGILKLFPGAGKTVLATFIASQLGIKTCILVDNDNLMKQWINAFINFTNLNEDSIGIIKQSLFVTNKPVTIAMIQSLSSKMKRNFVNTINKMDGAGFGLTLWDEVHEAANTDKRARVSLLFRTNNNIGLSATPFQTGYQEILMKNTIGEILYDTKQYDLQPQYYFVYFNSNLDKKYNYVMSKFQDYIKKKSFWNSIISNSSKYLDLIGKYTYNLLHNNHKTIIICMNHKQINAISEKLDQIGVEHRRFYGKEREIDISNDSVVVATYQFCG